MGRRGPKPTPTAIKKARGNPGHRPLNEEEPEYQVAEAKPPKDLKGAALEEWSRLAPDLVTLGVIKAPAVRLFAEYCQLVGEIDRCRTKIEKVGYEDARKLKYVQELTQLRGQMRQLAAELGLTPTSSAGVKAKNAKREAPVPADARAKKRARFLGVVPIDSKTKEA